MREQPFNSQPQPAQKNIILHIGWEKTGTSAIQSFCGRNADWLAKHGIHYPLLYDTPQHIFIHTGLAKSNPKRVRDLIPRVRAIVDESPCQTVLFSHESLHLDDPAAMREMLDGYNTRIIAYVRNPADAVISHFTTLLRFGSLPAHNLTKAIRFYKRNLLPCFDYYWALENFAASFGRENLTVRHYHPDALIGGQSITDFLHQIGLQDAEGSSWPQGRANLSIDADMLRMVSRIARATPGLKPPERKQLARTLFDLLIKKLGAEPSRPVQKFVSPTLRQKLYRYYEPNLQPLYDRYFDSEAIFKAPAHDQGTEEDLKLARKHTHSIARTIQRAKLVPPRIVKHTLNRDPYADTTDATNDDVAQERTAPLTTTGNPA
ncbi:MAG TPA: hypothetical protein DF699_06715 [Phycisphaerales bacterium]|nr:hypothetical protein [Phycisphaerae bacterium]HCT44886.1 hypothetical protein [Phycisphaerales bacterium]